MPKQTGSIHLPDTMSGVYLTGHGGLEKLEYRTDIPVPKCNPDEVLIEVKAAAINNTDINTRTGWYSKSVTGATSNSGSSSNDADASWTGQALQFPRIQGADVCGKIVASGDNVIADRIGERVIVRSLLQSYTDFRPFECWTLGSEINGGFAQYCVAPANETYMVNCDWSDAELASIPCAYSTAENAFHRIGLGQQTILITGASGGVGSAAIQLAKRRGATVIAMTTPSKSAQILALGADQTVGRDDDLIATLGHNSVDVIYDLVGGPQWPSLLETLKTGGRYVTSGAIAGPVTELDLRTLYLKDLTLTGTTFQDEIVFKNLVRYIERNEIKPIVSKTFPLSEISQAQTEFIAKNFIGKLVLIPDLLVNE